MVGGRYLAAGSYLLLIVSTAAAHCNPIFVSVDNGRLVVDQGWDDPIGFAAVGYLNGGEDCGLESAPTNRLITDVPGQDIRGMSVNSGLYLEPLARSASGVSDPDRRWFWFWDPSIESVALAPHDTPLRIRSILGFGTIELPQEDLPSPGSIKIADPQSEDIGVHSHLLRFELTGIGSPIHGAYGFYARMTSPTYEPSQPFLVMLNSGLSAVQLDHAAHDINYLAGSGDFDVNNDFDCGDIDALVAAIAGHSNDARYDLDHDGALTLADVQRWREHAGAGELPSGMPYLEADANLDGLVDGQDFVIWNTHKFTSTAAWCDGDFNADGVVDGQDFVIWNTNKFTSAVPAAVPEPVFYLGWSVFAALTYRCCLRS